MAAHKVAMCSLCTAGFTQGQLQKLQLDVAKWAGLACTLSRAAGWWELETCLGRLSQQAEAGVHPELLPLMQARSPCVVRCKLPPLPACLQSLSRFTFGPACLPGLPCQSLALIGQVGKVAASHASMHSPLLPLHCLWHTFMPLAS